MPRYTYRCLKCDQASTVFHSITEKLTDCELCDEGKLERLPSLPLTVSKKDLKQKPGQLVKQHIEETRKEVAREKQRLQEEVIGDHSD